jgi:glutaredoxin
MKKLMVIAGVMSILTGIACADSLFRWVDGEGKVHYGDRPASDAVNVEAKKFTAPVVPDDGTLSYAARLAKENFPVTLYVAEHCGEPCVQARALLNKRGVPYTEKFLATREDNAEFVRVSGGNGIPTMAVGKTYVQGFEPGQWESELDIAGYPKTAPYGARPIAPAARPVTAESSVEAAVPVE